MPVTRLRMVDSTVAAVPEVIEEYGELEAPAC
jgi:hypothetical protein